MLTENALSRLAFASYGCVRSQLRNLFACSLLATKTSGRTLRVVSDIVHRLHTLSCCSTAPYYYTTSLFCGNDVKHCCGIALVSLTFAAIRHPVISWTLLWRPRVGGSGVLCRSRVGGAAGAAWEMPPACASEVVGESRGAVLLGVIGHVASPAEVCGGVG